MITSKEYLAGSISSMLQTISMYPLDTLKVYKQSNIKKTIRIKNLYKGLTYPLLFDTFAGSLLFGTYYNLRKNNFSKEESSLITGIIVGTVMTPFDVYKIKNQCQIKKEINLFRGLHFTVGREIIGNYIYFATYDYFRSEYKLSPAVSGGLCGGIMWTVIYPIDNYKTNYTIKDISIKEFLKEGKFFKGYKYCLMRGIPANIIIFDLYEKINLLLD